MDKFHLMLKRIKKIEELYGSLENYVVNSTNFEGQHRMKIEEIYSSLGSEMEQVYQDLLDLELADLLDFQNLIGEVYGKFD